MPWEEKSVHNLMFKFKKLIVEGGHCHIPFVEKNLSQAKMSEEEFEKIKIQIENKSETHLVMSNMDSIHIFRLEEIIKKPRSVRTIDEFKGDKYDVWFKVGDLFVYHANHTDDEKQIVDQLDDLLNSDQTQYLFVNSQTLEIAGDNSEKYNQFSRWLELNRNLTYDYFIRNCELEENIYQESWEALNKRTQHFLIMAEQARHKGVTHRDYEKTKHLKESLENYLSAVINELNEVYIRPLINSFNEYECMRVAWEETQDGLMSPKIKSIINELLESDSDQLKSIELFLEYLQSSKSFLFSLKKRFTKMIGKEEYLLIENFLGRQEGLVDSFTCRGIYQKLESILLIKNWLKEVLDQGAKISPKELKSINLKLTHLLTIMSSISYEDNIFFKLVEEKTAKGVIKRNFEDEVKALIKGEDTKKAA